MATLQQQGQRKSSGGLIPKYRHHAHKKIHEVLVDFSQFRRKFIQEFFPLWMVVFVEMGQDHVLWIHIQGNILLASGDSVAVDALAAKIMGFDPLKIDYIKMAHDRGLGMGDVDQIEIVGMDESEVNALNFRFHVNKSPVIKWDQRLRKKTMNIKWLHNLLFNSPIFKTFIFASGFYHDRLWYPTTGKNNIEHFNSTEWGQMFDKYEYGKFPEFKEIKDWDPY